MNEMLNTLGKNARNAEVLVRNLSANEKNEVLLKVAEALTENADTLTAANALDVETAEKIICRRLWWTDCFLPVTGSVGWQRDFARWRRWRTL